MCDRPARNAGKHDDENGSGASGTCDGQGTARNVTDRREMQANVTMRTRGAGVREKIVMARRAPGDETGVTGKGQSGSARPTVEKTPTKMLRTGPVRPGKARGTTCENRSRNGAQRAGNSEEACSMLAWNGDERDWKDRTRNVRSQTASGRKRKKKKNERAACSVDREREQRATKVTKASVLTHERVRPRVMATRTRRAEHTCVRSTERRARW